MITREEEKKGVSLYSFLGWIGFGYDLLMIMWILIYLCIVSQKKRKKSTILICYYCSSNVKRSRWYSQQRDKGMLKVNLTFMQLIVFF